MSNTANINLVSMTTSTASHHWRTDDGIKLEYGWALNNIITIDSYLNALKGSLPEVNTIRLDFNIYTLNNSDRLNEWREFALKAAEKGYKLIIQDSDGAIANTGYSANAKDVMSEAENLGGADALRDNVSTIPESYAVGSAQNFDYLSESVDYIERVSQDWGAILAWFNAEEQEEILEAVYGWEILNEPILYGANATLYAEHMRDIIYIHNIGFGDKRILIGGLNYSGQFGNFSKEDLALIRESAGDRLIWSAHFDATRMAPGDVLDPSGSFFLRQLNERFSIGVNKDEITNNIVDENILEAGDDIIITETKLQTLAGALDYNSASKDGIQSFNFQQVWQWFAENGIGQGWWPVIGPNSSLLTVINSENKVPDWGVYGEAVALAHEVWALKEDPEILDVSEHYGSSGADWVTIGGTDLLTDHLTNGIRDRDVVSGRDKDAGMTISGRHGLFFGFDGNDTIIGSDTTDSASGMDMLYGGVGSDLIQGLSGSDYLFGGEGADTIWGGEGHDTIIDRSGSGEARGGAGDDYIQIAGGKSYGDDGNDTLLFSSNGNQTAYGGSGADTFVAMGNGQIGVKDFSAADADKLSLAFWADDPDVERIIVMLHHNGQGEATGSLVVSNEVGGSYRVFGGYSSSSPLDFAATNFVDAEGVWIAYRYFDGVENKIAYRIADGGNVTAFDPTASDYSDGKLFGNATNEVIVLDEDAQFWGGAGRDIFVATELNVRIRDFNVSADSDYIDLSAWNLSGPDKLQISDRFTGEGAQTNEVYIHDQAGHNIRVALYDENGSDVSLGVINMTADMFIF